MIEWPIRTRAIAREAWAIEARNRRNGMIKQEYAPLSGLLYYGIGGIARHLLVASTLADVLEALDFVQRNRTGPVVVVGLGSNLLFPDGLFDGTVLRIAGSSAGGLLEARPGAVAAFAGEELDAVVNFGFARGYAGLEWAGGLPGTVGAAVRGNVGAFGGELKDVLESAEVVDTSAEPEILRLGKAELEFAYRSSLVKRRRNLVVLSATFDLAQPDEPELERARSSYRANIEYRQKNHPMEYPTCGSVFKNIAAKDQVEKVLTVWPDVEPLVNGRWHGKVSMGYTINRLGLAGCRRGSAQISEKHNNFIVNLGGATFSDVYGLIQTVMDSVESTFGFAPEPEVELVGTDQ